MKRVMGIDPSLMNTAWVLLESEGRTVRYIDSQTVCHMIRGRGRWTEKIRDMLTGMESAWHGGFKIHQVRIEKPPFGSRGRNQASSVSLLAVMDLAWQISWMAAEHTSDVIVSTPDNKTKVQRSQFLPGLIQDWPKRTNEHIRDAAWIALKGC